MLFRSLRDSLPSRVFVIRSRAAASNPNQTLRNRSVAIVAVAQLIVSDSSWRRNADTALIAALVAGATVREAAKRAKVSESTVYRRLDDPGFGAQLVTARDRVVREIAAQLVAAGTDAVTTLRELLADEKGSVRLGAARVILEHTMRFRESVELAERVTRLEEALHLNGKERTNGKP